ncbi:MAG: superoxide dismutase [Candidatus Woesearchaeota archaeon]
MTHELPNLPYKYDALEPHIDEETMKIHHTKHHQGYVDKLNAAIEGYDDLKEKDIVTLLKEIAHVPDSIKQAVINNGGGHANHNLFWEIMSPSGGNPSGEVFDAIKNKWGDFDSFKEEFKNAALARFGSGWAWLVVDENKELEIITTPNQDSPWMTGKKPIIGLDMWEHSFYKKYGPDKPSYIDAFFKVLNWNKVNELYESK